jgi:uncharacterized protein YcnI
VKNLFASLITISSIILLLPSVALAHVTVTPGRVGVGQELTFNISVPNEQQTPVVDLKVDIPSGVTNVTPTNDVGWNVITSNNGNAKDPEVTSITWSGGQIPVAERQDFSFSAQVPANATSLNWRAYQTYADGTIVHWDQKPAGSDDSTGNAGPYSITKVINDLSSATPTKSSSSILPSVLSVVALFISVGSVVLRKKS